MALRLMIKKIAETVMHEVSFNTLAGNVKAAGIKTSTDSMISYAGCIQLGECRGEGNKEFHLFCAKNGRR